MSNVRRAKRGFTLVEVIVATALLGIGIAFGMASLGAMTMTENKVRMSEKLNRLAVLKLEQVLAEGNIATAQTDGDFQDYNEPGYSWTLAVAPSGIENVDTILVTVETDRGYSTDPVGRATSLAFTPPETTEGTQ
ncbi:MAG TPA: type II secretion system protein [Fimbriimonas sp.]|nr:type II secretion system protein [Fimbriimonas sp.]